MAKSRFRGRNGGIPAEKHDTAAWANTGSVKPVSNVTVPSETQVRNAKEYADANEK